MFAGCAAPGHLVKRTSRDADFYGLRRLVPTPVLDHIKRLFVFVLMPTLGWLIRIKGAADSLHRTRLRGHRMFSHFPSGRSLSDFHPSMPLHLVDEILEDEQSELG